MVKTNHQHPPAVVKKWRTSESHSLNRCFLGFSPRSSNTGRDSRLKLSKIQRKTASQMMSHHLSDGTSPRHETFVGCYGGQTAEKCILQIAEGWWLTLCTRVEGGGGRWRGVEGLWVSNEWLPKLQWITIQMVKMLEGEMPMKYISCLQFCWNFNVCVTMCHTCILTWQLYTSCNCTSAAEHHKPHLPAVPFSQAPFGWDSWDLPS